VPDLVLIFGALFLPRRLSCYSPGPSRSHCWRFARRSPLPDLVLMFGASPAIALSLPSFRLAVALAPPVLTRGVLLVVALCLILILFCDAYFRFAYFRFSMSGSWGLRRARLHQHLGTHIKPICISTFRGNPGPNRISTFSTF
jgi:hypothetical protein